MAVFRFCLNAILKPDCWKDEGFKALYRRGFVVTLAPNDFQTNKMRAVVLSGRSGDAWEAGPRSAAELKEAATYFERVAALISAPVMKAELAGAALWCRSQAVAM